MWVVIVLHRHPVALFSSAKGHVENVSWYMPICPKKDREPMYNQAGVDALDAVRTVVASFGAPLLFRKLYGILNAMEMHVEETPYSVEALQHLGKALEATARLYRIDQQKHTQLARALAIFLSKVEKK
jgi:hypothetical protein